MKLRFVIRTPTHCMKIIQNAVFLIFRLGHFLPSFVRLKVTCHVTLFDRKLQVFKHSPKWTVFGIYNELLSTQNINVARFARNVKCDFFCDFQTLCITNLMETLHCWLDASKEQIKSVNAIGSIECQSEVFCQLFAHFSQN